MAEIEGMREALKSFKQIKKAAKPKVMRAALNAALTPGLKAARSAAPRGSEAHKTYKGRTVAPGFLSRNIRKSTRISRNRQIVMGKILAAPEAFYGSFSEFGTKRQTARPFFFKSIDQVENEMNKRYFEKMHERIMKEFTKP